MKTLTIKLTAPLQSYGNEATFERRTTNDYPTKSAMIGMVAAALGYRRTDARILDLNDLDFAVRIDQVGKNLTDYQTVEWKKNTRKITYRDYLQDAVFVVALGSQDDQLIDHIKVALKHPYFPLFLGRRSNAPAGVLDIRDFPDETPITALQKLTWQATKRYQNNCHSQSLEIIADANLIPAAASAMVKDQVGSFDQRHRSHRFRAITKIRVDLDKLDVQVKEPETQHDPMEYL